MKKWIFLGLALAILTGVAVGLYLYNKPVESMTEQDAQASLTAPDLYQAFDLDENSANAQYLGKVVEVTGTIESISEDDPSARSVILHAGDGAMGGVVCRLDPTESSSWTTGQLATFRGECTGKLMDVELARCVYVH